MRRDFDAALLTSVDILIPNETEFCALINLLPQTRSAAEDFNPSKLSALTGDELHLVCRQLGIAIVIVTLGERGCFVSQPHGHIFIPALRAIEVVDTTGAGDAFVGAFAAAFAELNPGEVEKAAHLANVGAALSVTRAGAAAAMPHRAEIDALAAVTSLS